MRFNTSQCSRCLIPLAVKLKNDLLDMIVEAVELQIFNFDANAILLSVVGLWSIICPLGFIYFNILLTYCCSIISFFVFFFL